jgi:hypothetical protein
MQQDGRSRISARGHKSGQSDRVLITNLATERAWLGIAQMAAKKLADGLVQNADRILAYKPPKPN